MRFIITAAIIELLSELLHHKHRAKRTIAVATEEGKRSAVLWSSALVYISIIADDKVEVRPYMRAALITHPDAQANENHL